MATKNHYISTRIVRHSFSSLETTFTPRVPLFLFPRHTVKQVFSFCCSVCFSRRFCSQPRGVELFIRLRKSVSLSLYLSFPFSRGIGLTRVFGTYGFSPRCCFRRCLIRRTPRTDSTRENESSNTVSSATRKTFEYRES